MSSDAPLTATYRSREVLLDEFNLIKANAYFRIFGASFVVLIYFILKNYYAEANPIYIFIVYISVDFYLSITRIEKKINILYEIEKARNIKMENANNEK